ncbi:MAG: HD domain-containing protein [Bacteroidales bacterium]|nr:HD domain-containing protein [Bacteroidales bacterium]
MDVKELYDLKIWFTNYVSTFNFSNPDLQQNINLKEEHTKQVCRNIILIGKQIGLNDDELRFAEILALFHDLGRFEQYSKYRTFMDSRSEDHALLGIKILEKHNVLRQFDDELKDLILSSIRYHNQSLLPQNAEKRHLFYIKLLRDADKLDILRIVVGYYSGSMGKKNDTISLEMPDTPGISQEVYKSLILGKTVNIKDVNNLNDLKLLQTGWVFDINFKPTMDYIKRQRSLERMQEVLPQSDEIKRIFNMVFAFETKN